MRGCIIKIMKKAESTKPKIDVGQELRNLGALIEKNNHEIGAVAEQYGSINEKLDSHTEMIEGLSVDMKNVKATLILNTETLKSHTEMIGELAVDMTTVREDVRSIKESLKTKVDHKEFVELKRQVLAE